MSSQVTATLATAMPFGVPLFVLCTTLVVIWALYLPTTVRDTDRRRLAPNGPPGY